MDRRAAQEAAYYATIEVLVLVSLFSLSLLPEVHVHDCAMVS